jgi:alpha-glucosidase
MVFSGEDTLSFLEWTQVDSKQHDAEWQPAWGIHSFIKDRYNELSVRFRSGETIRSCILRIRVYDDGCAFRYEFPELAGPITVLHELTEFNFAEDAASWWAWADYNTLEKTYQQTPLSKTDHVALPFTMQFQSGTCIAVHEAAVDDFTTMTLRRSSSNPIGFSANLVPWSDGSAVKTPGPFITPWRTLFITGEPGGLLTSDLLWNLNQPSVIDDVTWIRPIRYIGIWWDMHLGLSTWKAEGNRHGATTERAKRYIDFAAKNGIEGVLVEGWNTGWEHWGKQGAFDFTTPYPDFNLKEVVRYGRMKGVEIIGHLETGGDIVSFETRMDSAFSMYRRLGIRYVKTGYAGPVNPPTENHHGQYMVRHMNLVMRKAAEYGLMLDVHEPVLPTGWGRTYPNLMTFEGVRGTEWNAWSEGNAPAHTCTLPFTRGLAGPIDYTPGILDTRLDNYATGRIRWNEQQKGSTAMHSTVSNQLALLVVNYSPMQMAADLVENYENNRLFRYIARLPVSYDETRVLAAAIGEYVVIARRRGDTWYVAGITNEKGRELILNLDFLSSGSRYVFEACFDTPDAHYEKNPESYSDQTGTLDTSFPFIWHMSPGGGGLMIIRELR